MSADQTTDPLVGVIARLAAEYDRDDQCDRVKINRLIEEGGYLLGQRMGSWDRVVDLGIALEAARGKQS